MNRLLAVVFLVVLGVIAYFMIDIKKTSDGEMPAITVGEGRMPKFDVDVGSIEVGQEAATVNVPEVQVGTQEKQISVPKVHLKGPGDD